MSENTSSRRRIIAEAAKVAAAGFLVFLLVSSVAIQAFSIPTPSMSPTLMEGDYVLANKLAMGGRVPFTDYRLPALSSPSRGDVVIFEAPHLDDVRFVKRIVGLPGDTLAMRDQVLFVNGVRLEEPYARSISPAAPPPRTTFRWQRAHLAPHVDARWYAPSAASWGPLLVPPGHYFVLGDARGRSEDSRYWGFVPRDRIEARVWRVYYSFDPSAPALLPFLQNVRWGRLGSTVK